MAFLAWSWSSTWWEHQENEKKVPRTKVISQISISRIYKYTRLHASNIARLKFLTIYVYIYMCIYIKIRCSNHVCNLSALTMDLRIRPKKCQKRSRRPQNEYASSLWFKLSGSICPKNLELVSAKWIVLVGLERIAFYSMRCSALSQDLNTVNHTHHHHQHQQQQQHVFRCPVGGWKSGSLQKHLVWFNFTITNIWKNYDSAWLPRRHPTVCL